MTRLTGIIGHKNLKCRVTKYGNNSFASVQGQEINVHLEGKVTFESNDKATNTLFRKKPINTTSAQGFSAGAQKHSPPAPSDSHPSCGNIWEEDSYITGAKNARR
jgi:hypothetical protein